MTPDRYCFLGFPVSLAIAQQMAEFEAAVRRDGNLDNLGAGVDYDGPRCGNCRTLIAHDSALCDECAPDGAA